MNKNLLIMLVVLLLVSGVFAGGNFNLSPSVGPLIFGGIDNERIWVFGI